MLGFDFDGTLLDSRLRHTKTLEIVGKEAGVNFTPRDLELYMSLKCTGMNGESALKQLGVDPALARTLAQAWQNKIEHIDMMEFDVPYPHALEGLSKLKDAGIPLVLVTKRNNVEGTLSQIDTLGFSDFFNDVYALKSDGLSKYDATKHFNFSAIIGDTEVDQVWAADLGVRFFASSYGFRDASFWHKRGIESYSSLDALFGALEDLHL